VKGTQTSDSASIGGFTHGRGQPGCRAFERASDADP
jgi:hypothetical protein